jgi:hypothetical protein
MSTTRKKKPTASNQAPRSEDASKDAMADSVAPALPQAWVVPGTRRASRTKQHAGRAVAVYIDDGQGRRLVVATAHVFSDGLGALFDPVIVALTKEEAMHASAVLRQLADELPPESRGAPDASDTAIAGAGQ